MTAAGPPRAIGIVRSGHRDLETTPIQAALNRAEQATIEIAGAYQDGPEGLAGFDYAWPLPAESGRARASPGESGRPRPGRFVP